MSKNTSKFEKGESLIDFPDSFIVIDLETTGLSPAWDSIIEVAGICYKNGLEINRFSELVRPDEYYIRDEDDPQIDYTNINNKDIYYIDDFLVELTGITNHMLSSARSTDEVMSDFLSFVGNSIVIGHNVNFDLNFIYKYAQKLGLSFKNNFVDTLRMARRVHPELRHHRLDDMSKFYKLNRPVIHRSLDDCIVTKQVFDRIKIDVMQKYGSFESFRKELKNKTNYSYIAKNIVSDVSCFDESHPLYNRTCVFTGTLERMTRKEAMQLVVNCGGLIGNNVTKETNYLILGNLDYCKSIKDGKSSKWKRAETLKMKGEDISVIPEDVFYDLLANK